MGVLLYQCITGETPFRGNYGALYRQHTESPPDMNALPPEIPPSLRALIRPCLEKKQRTVPRALPSASPCWAARRPSWRSAASGPAGLSLPSSAPGSRSAPHPTQPWAWYCHHETSNEQATVEVHFADEPGLRPRAATRRHCQRQADALRRRASDQTNRLLLRPGESWTSPPQGQYGSGSLVRRKTPADRGQSSYAADARRGDADVLPA